MSFVRRLTLVVVLAALLSGLVYGTGWAARSGALPWSERPSDRSSDDGSVAADRTVPDKRIAPQQPARPSESAKPRKREKPQRPESPTVPELEPGPALLGPGDTGPEVRALQARLRQIDWFYGDVTDFYGDLTTDAVRGFQAKRGFPVTGEVDRRTLDRLHEMTTEPTTADLTNQSTTNTPGALDPRCRAGRVLCVDKSTNTLRWVVDGKVLEALDVRFGGSSTPTREGEFSVYRKSRDHVSSLYDTSMPFAMFFSGGQAVHYSPDFAAVGYDGASHGCVNVRDYDAIAWLYDQVQLGDTVVVYWS